MPISANEKSAKINKWRTYLILGRPHGIALLVLQGLVLEVELDIGAAVRSFHNGEEYFDGAFGNWLHVLGLAEFDFVAPDVAHLIHKEHLVDVDLAPLIHNILNNLLALELTHLRDVTSIHFIVLF